MAPATTIQPATATEPAEHRFLIRNLDWERYEALLSLFEDGGPRINYLDGNVELMSPLLPHEGPKRALGFMVETVTEELGIPMDEASTTTFKRRESERGLEADESYYLYGHVGKIRDRRRIDLDVDPPPDLAIEVEFTSSLLDKLAIYAGICVPEIWRHDGERLAVLWLGPDGTYSESATSRAFPLLATAEIERFLREFDPDHATPWRRRFRTWVREVLLPRHLGPQGPAGGDLHVG